jgi:hypothetical protein
MTLEALVLTHLKDLAIGDTTKKMVAENMAKDIMKWINDRRDAKVTNSPTAVVMTPGTAKSVDKKLGGGAGLDTPPTSV